VQLSAGREAGLLAIVADAVARSDSLQSLREQSELGQTHSSPNATGTGTGSCPLRSGRLPIACSRSPSPSPVRKQSQSSLSSGCVRRFESCC